MINYQGTLTNPSGTEVPNGNYNIEFKIYNVPSGGAALWSEVWNSTTTQVPVVNGIFNVMLGFQNPIPESFFANNLTTYLGMKVGTDTELLPRQLITSVGYAFSAGNGVPKGGVIMWSGAVNQIPADWALCDGVERTLSDGTKVTPPNLKDRFILGAGGSYAVMANGGSTAKNFSHVHTGPNHSHTFSGTTQPLADGQTDSYDETNEQSGANPSHTHPYSGTTAAGGAGNTGASGSATQDIMPPYLALAFIMKL